MFPDSRLKALDIGQIYDLSKEVVDRLFSPF